MNKQKFLLITCMIALCCAAYALHAQAQTQTQTKDFFVQEYKTDAPLAQKESPGLFFATLFKFVFSLVVVIVLVYATLFVLKQFTSKYKPRAQTEIGLCQILDTLTLEPQKKIYVLALDDQRVLIVGSQDKDLVLIDKIDDVQAARDIVAKVKAKWDKAQPFDEHLRIAARKNEVQAALRSQLHSLTDFIKGLKGKS